MKFIYLFVAALFFAQSSSAALLTNSADPRFWQGADINTFASLYSLTTTQVIANGLLDDSNFDATGYVAGTLINYNGGAATSGAYGTSLDQPGISDGNDSTYNYREPLLIEI